jgi:hypothetical protein
VDEDEARVTEDESGAARIAALERKAESVRADLDRLLLELRRRGQSALDWRQQLRARPWLLAVPAAALGIVLASVLGARSRRRRAQVPLAQLRQALGL